MKFIHNYNGLVMDNTNIICVLIFSAFFYILSGMIQNDAKFIRYRFNHGKLSVFISIFLLTWLIATALLYLKNSYFNDHLAPSVASISQISMQGGDIYPSLPLQHFYGLLYGPLLFQINGAAMSVIDGVVGMKIAGVTAFLLSLLCLFQANKSYLSLSSAYIKISTLLVLLLTFSGIETVFFNRSDPFLFLCAAMSVLALTFKNVSSAALLIGITAGLAINLKIHGFFYIMPQAIALIAANPRAKTLSIIGLGSIAGAIAFLLPFLDPTVDFKNYIKYLQLASNHGLILQILRDNILSAVLLLLVMGKPRASHIPQAYGLLVCSVIVCVVASKAGGGMWHLSPFIPAVLYLGLREEISAGNLAARKNLSIFYALMVIFFYFTQSNIISTYRFTHNILQEPLQELVQLRQQFPIAEMGATNDASYYNNLYKLRVFAPQHNIPTLDIGAWMDLKQAGVPEALLTNRLKDCKIPFWIMPSEGDLFSIQNPYNYDEILFSKDFVATFKVHYRLHSKRKYFSVWQCVEKP